MARPTDEQAALIRARRAEALRMRADGTPLADIADRLHADTGFAQGYTADRQKPRQLTAAVAKDLGAAIREEYAASREAARTLSAQLLGRLEMMWQAIEDRLAEGDLRAVEAGLRIVERTARMTGVEASPLDRLGPDGEQRVAVAVALLVEAAQSAADDGPGG